LVVPNPTGSANSEKGNRGGRGHTKENVVITVVNNKELAEYGSNS